MLVSLKGLLKSGIAEPLVVEADVEGVIVVGCAPGCGGGMIGVVDVAGATS
jgi:hypothetical protein